MWLLVLVLLLSVAPSSWAEGCQVYQPFTQPRGKRLSNSAALLSVHGPSKWLPEIAAEVGSELENIQVTLSSGIVQGQDFFLWLSPYTLPEQTHMTLFLQLYPGKLWFPSLQNLNTEILYLESVVVKCQDSKSHATTTSSSLFAPIMLANIYNKSPLCPSPPFHLPGASVKLQRFVTQVVQDCQDPLVIRAEHLKWRLFSSLKLLLMQPAVLIVDGTDQTLETAASKVDKFLAAHAVLTVAWEPLNNKEPRYWILLPHPPGMPGHLFALLDQLQWYSPALQQDITRMHRIASAPSYLKPPGTTADTQIVDPARARITKRFCARAPLASTDEHSCPLGCPHTKLIGSTASGYGADAYNIYSKLRDGLLYNTPIQAYPTVLGPRITPPFWEGQEGWTYTFGACKSNFLDCFFLAHSPCPPVSLDVRVLNQTEVELFGFNRTRLVLADGRKVGFELKGWDALVGSGSTSVPLRSIQDLWPSALPSRHVFYSYIFRPKYILRQAVYERLLHFEGTINKPLRGQEQRYQHGLPCAALHVRRGDILFHPNQARYYLPLQAYIRAAKIHLDTLKIRTIMLFTDSRMVIEEAQRCATDNPELCGDLIFQFVEKDRWSGGEGGWENPFPSGNNTGELLDLQVELSLAQRCDLAVTGESEFGELLYQHMCCGFPIGQRGRVPQRCVCPPRVKLLQTGFTCEKGNSLLCGSDEDLESLLIDDKSRKGEHFSASQKAFKSSTTVQIQPKIGGETKTFLLENIDRPKIHAFVEAAARESLGIMCQKYDSGPDRSAVCSNDSH